MFNDNVFIPDLTRITKMSTAEILIYGGFKMRKKFIFAFVLCLLCACVLGTTCLAYEEGVVNVSAISKLQSAHPYQNDTEKTWIYTHPTSADNLEITFSNDTETGNTKDFIYIFDGYGTQVGKYSGTELAGKTVKVIGNVVKIHLSSDNRLTGNGFTVTNINAVDDIGAINDLTCYVSSETSISFSFTAPLGANLISLEYSTDEMNWKSATTEPLNEKSTQATVTNLELGIKYWFRLNVKGGKNEGFSNVVTHTIENVSNDNFEFSNGTITKYIGNTPFVMIPANIDGIKVTSIGADAFAGCKDLTKVVIPDTVTEIGMLSFQACANLSTIVISSYSINIGVNAFYNCNKAIIYGYDNSDAEKFSKSYKIPFRSLNDTEPSTILSGTCGNSTYFSLFSNGDLYINGTGDINSTPWNTHKKMIYNVFINNGVTSLSKDIFNEYKNLQNVIMPETIVSIGDNAFYNCNALENVVIPNSVTSIGNYAFNNCTSLNNITIPDSVVSIGMSAFNNCKNLRKIYLGKGIKNISYDAFGSCISLEDVYLSDLELYCNITFSDSESSPLCYASNLYVDGVLIKELLLPSNISKVKAYSFPNGGFSTLIVPENIETIDIAAFYGNKTLNTVKIKEGLKIIEESAFQRCLSLKSVELPDSVTTLNDYSFEGCIQLKDLILGNGIEYIGFLAFQSCISLENVHIKDISSYCKINIDIGYNGYQTGPLCYADNIYINGILTSDIIIPDGVAEIKEYSFYEFDGITSIRIPDTVISIGNAAFKYCDSLTEVVIMPNALTNIGSEAFYGCSKLKKIVLHDKLVSVGDSAFGGSNSLSSGNIIYTGDQISWDNITIGKSNYSFANPLYRKFITYKDGDGRILSYDWKIAGRKITSQELPTKEGYTAVAYMDSDFHTPYDHNIELTENVVLFLDFKRVSCSIFYNSNGGINAPESQTTGINSSISLSWQTPIKNGYKFVGWAIDETSTVAQYNPGDTLETSEGDVTLYAVWKRDVSTKTQIVSNIIMVTPTNAQIGDCIIAACYKDNRMVYVDTYSYNGETTIPFIPNAEYDTIKIMVWESFDNLKPLSSEEEV